MGGRRFLTFGEDNSSINKILLALVILLVILEGWEIYSIEVSKKETGIIRQELEAMITSLFGQQNRVNVADFMAKLTAHNESAKYKGIIPNTILQVNQQNLATLSKQIVGLDENYIGAFVIQYPEEVVIYDFGNDKILAQLSLPKQQQ